MPRKKKDEWPSDSLQQLERMVLEGELRVKKKAFQDMGKPLTERWAEEQKRLNSPKLQPILGPRAVMTFSLSTVTIERIMQRAGALHLSRGQYIDHLIDMVEEVDEPAEDED